MFKAYITEGMIKLPASVKHEVERFFLERALTYLAWHASEAAEDGGDHAIIKASLKQLAQHFRMQMPTPDKRVGQSKLAQTVIKLTDVPASYAERVAQVKGPEARAALDKLSFKLIVSFDGKHKLLGGEAGVFYERPPTMLISLPGSGLKASTVANWILVGKHVEVARHLEQALGTIEHELTHGIQFMVLQQLHPKQADVEGHANAKASAATEFDDVYHSSQLEFDPQVKSAIRAFKLQARREGAASKQERRDLIDRFTWADTAVDNLPEPSHVPTSRSAFFSSLKRVDMKQWRKAVKLLSGAVLLENEIGAIELTELKPDSFDPELLKHLLKLKRPVTYHHMTPEAIATKALELYHQTNQYYKLGLDNVTVYFNHKNTYVYIVGDLMDLGSHVTPLVMYMLPDSPKFNWCSVRLAIASNAEQLGAKLIQLGWDPTDKPITIFQR